MQNIIIIFAFLFSCINFSVFVNRLIIKIPELKDTDYWLNLITLGKKNISENEIKQYIKEKNIKYIFIQTRDRKITKTGYDFQTVNVNDPNLKTLLTLSKKEVFKDNQSIIYELIF